MPQFTTSYVKQLTDANPDGTRLGQTAADKVAMYGATPVAQRATSGLHQASLLSISSNTTVAASLTAWILEVTATLVGLGIWV